MKIVAVVMAGGSGERFWPLSRKNYPKQLLKIAGNRSMLSAACERIQPLVQPEDIFIITGKVLKPVIEAQAGLVPPDNVIAEPTGKNTAACLALACAYLEHRYPDEEDLVMVVLTADHYIHDMPTFLGNCEVAVQCAEETGALITFGVVPSRPETGYGYIELGEQLAGHSGVFRVKEFREKPDLETARGFLQSGNFLWNSGMFIWRKSSLKREFEKHAPDIFSHIDPMRLAYSAPHPESALAEAFKPLPQVSIDVAVMEKAENRCVVRATFDWDDIGTWSSLGRLLAKDANANVSFGNSILIDSQNTIAYSVSSDRNGEEQRLVVGFHLDDLIIVSTKDAVFVFPSKYAQQVKEVVAYLREQGFSHYL